MTAIVTGTDGRSYVHEMAGEAPVFVNGAVELASAQQAAIAGHAWLVAWLRPMEPGGARRARVRLPTGQIAEVAAETVCSAANIARARIGLARRLPATRLAVGAQACPQGALRGVAAPAVGLASGPAEAIGLRKPRTVTRPTAR